MTFGPVDPNEFEPHVDPNVIDIFTGEPVEPAPPSNGVIIRTILDHGFPLPHDKEKKLSDTVYEVVTRPFRDALETADTTELTEKQQNDLGLIADATAALSQGNTGAFDEISRMQSSTGRRSVLRIRAIIEDDE